MNLQIENALLLLHDEKGYEFRQADLFIEGDHIAAIGQKPQGFVPQRVLNGKNRLVMPGFVNAHTHCYMTVMRNCADDLAFGDWLFGTIDPMEAGLTAEDGYWGTLLGSMEMLRSGTTSFIDMSIWKLKNETLRAVEQIGIRALLSHGIVGEDAAEGQGRIDATLAMMRGDNTGLTRVCLSPHAIYSCKPALCSHIMQVAREKNLIVNMHLSESKQEIIDAQALYGCSPVVKMAQLGLFDQPTVLAHCVQVDEQDIALLANPHVSVATNPVSNMKLGNGFAPIPAMLKAGVNLCLGTDGTASNNTLNMFQELRTLCLIHKGVTCDPTAVSAFEGFCMATIGGARAMGMENCLGRIAPGYKADLAILDLGCPQASPRSDLMAALAYSMNGSEVETTIVNGEIVMEQRRFAGIDEQAVYKKVDDISKGLKEYAKSADSRSQSGR